MHPLFFLSITTLLLLILTTTTATKPNIGVTFDATKPNLPPLSSTITTLIHHKISTVHLINPTPISIHSFSNTNITLLISLPNTFIYSFSSNQSSSATWITNTILPFYNTTLISIINFHSTNQITPFHLPALRNLHSNLLKLGIENVKVSVTFPFETIVVKAPFTPSRAEFQEPSLIRPLVRFLKTMNSSFLVTLYPYNVYRSDYQIPVEFALFRNYTFSFRADVVSGVMYWNLFDMMVDSVFSALKGLGEGNVPVIVAETGWPNETLVKSDGYYAEVYLTRLMDHLRNTGHGALLRKYRVSEVYVYELFGNEWGIMNQNLSLKYDLDFSGFEAVKNVDKWFVEKVLYGVIIVFAFLLQYVVLVDWLKPRRRRYLEDF